MREAVTVPKIKAAVEGHLPTIQHVRDIAEVLNVTSGTLRRTFRQQTGVPLGCYVTGRRIARMKRLLRQTRLTHRQISYRAGYRRADTAARACKRETGQTMTDYRREHRAG